MNETSKHIVQIIPCDGWFAVYADDDEELITSPLVAWALIETTYGDADDGDKDRSIVGMEVDGPGIGEVDSVNNFIGYSQTTDKELLRKVHGEMAEEYLSIKRREDELRAQRQAEMPEWRREKKRYEDESRQARALANYKRDEEKAARAEELERQEWERTKAAIAASALATQATNAT